MTLQGTEADAVLARPNLEHCTRLKSALLLSLADLLRAPCCCRCRCFCLFPALRYCGIRPRRGRVIFA
jgi:hypothetical protein